MMNPIRMHCLAATTAILALWSVPGFAQQTDEPTSERAPSTPRRSVSFLDLTASAGYSTNPFLSFGDSTGSAFGRVGARGVHTWVTERTSASVSGFAEGSTYFNDYGFKSIFSLTGDVQHQASEKVSVFGSAGVSGDLSGQLSNRFLYVPPGPSVPDNTVPLPPSSVQDPDLFSFAGRQYRVYGQAGAAFRTSARSSITVSGGASRVFFTNDLLNDYTTVFANGAYNHTLSERTTIGVNVRGEHTEYSKSSDSSTIINPSFTVNTRLSEYWDVSGAIGVVLSSFDRAGDTSHSTGLSLDGSICHNSETERLCGRIARNAQSLSRGELVNTTSASLEWYKKLDEKQTLQASAGVTRYATKSSLIDNFRSHYFRASVSYSRVINGRLSGGADLSARLLRSEGPDPDTDLNGSVFLRYRLGDLG